MTVWDLQENVVKHITYDHGTDVEVEKREAIAKQQAEEAQQVINDPAISGCVDQLSRAYLTEQGNTAYVPAEKTLSFRDQCRQSALAASTTAVMSSQTAASSASPVTDSDSAAAKRCGSIDKAGGVVLHDREGYWMIASAGGRPAEGYENMPKVGPVSSYCGCLTVEINRQAMRITKIVAGNVLPASSCEQDQSLK
ncbi:DUF4087 domain-containing protein [Caballeronia sp. LZ062]|nr:DUF4087 domain-containing protein [Caballeronia sp. LZ062]